MELSGIAFCHGSLTVLSTQRGIGFLVRSCRGPTAVKSEVPKTDFTHATPSLR